jgi:hypothetical protein
MARYETLVEDFNKLPETAKPAAVDFMEIVAGALPPKEQLEEMM